MNGIPLINHVDITGPFQAIGPGDTPSRRKIFSCRPAGGDGVGPSDRQPKEAGTAGVPSVGRTVGPTPRNGVGGPSDRQSKEAGAAGVPSVGRTVGPTLNETACARKILSTLGRRAYRQPVSAADIDLLMAFYQSARARRGFEAGIQNALQLILATPKFLFRSEPDPANIPPRGAYRLGDFELASRLSFFLWSSIPDDELLNVAAQGKLKDPAVLDAQVKRMLSDRRSDALVTNFAGQWLFLRNLQSARPDGELFPNFDDNLRQAFRRESELFFESIMRENRSVLDLLNANYTYVNERLARHYGIPNVYGTHFRRVTLTDDNRRGLLSQGSILTVTSYPNRTSPVLRGKWILENIMGTPPPAPPSNVPPLKENEEGAKTPRSVRELVEEHRKSPACSGCHSVMDPLGFSLENFDATGEWRIKDGSGPIDVSGQLADGTKVDGPVSLRQAILKHPEQFARTLTEKLLTYALGRGLEYYDTSVVRGIVREAARNDYRFSDLIAGIVKSAPFQMKVKTTEDSKL